MEILREIDRYLSGELIQSEVDELWAELMYNPEILDWLVMELTIWDRYNENGQPDISRLQFELRHLPYIHFLDYLGDDDDDEGINTR